jgi:peptide/nickel transport system substrate-binding protein
MNNAAIPRLAACAFLALALCAGTAPVLAGKSNNTLNVAFPREVVTLDGLYSNLRENDILSLAVDDVLYTVDPESLQPVPLAAASHTVVDDRTIDVELRRGIRFHDGSEPRDGRAHRAIVHVYSSW